MDLIFKNKSTLYVTQEGECTYRLPCNTSRAGLGGAPSTGRRDLVDKSQPQMDQNNGLFTLFIRIFKWVPSWFGRNRNLPPHLVAPGCWLALAQAGGLPAAPPAPGCPRTPGRRPSPGDSPVPAQLLRGSCTPASEMNKISLEMAS